MLQEFVFTPGKAFVLERKAVVHQVYVKYSTQCPEPSTHKNQRSFSASYPTLKDIQDCLRVSRGNLMKAGHVLTFKFTMLFVFAAGCSQGEQFRMGSNMIEILFVFTNSECYMGNVFSNDLIMYCQTTGSSWEQFLETESLHVHIGKTFSHQQTQLSQCSSNFS